MELQDEKEAGKETEIKAKLGAKFLNFFSSDVDSARKNTGSTTQKVLETFEIKMTKSIVLHEVIEKCESVSTFDDALNEGELVKVENVKLSLENEMELRTVKLFSNGMFKGLKVPGAGGLDINNVFNSMFKDYAYKLRGDIGGQRILIKIPVTFENEFENSYCVDDLFVGKVTIVGVYKGKIKADDLMNSFQFFQGIGCGDDNVEQEYQEVHYSQYEEKVQNIKFASLNDKEEYHYIDVLAIIQQISEKRNKENYES